MPAEPSFGAGVSCSEAASWLPALVDGTGVDGTGVVAPEIWAHARTCLRCQAELARYRHLLRSLHTLRGQRVMPSPGSLRGTLAAVESARVERAVRASRRVAIAAYVGGAVVATAASAAGMLVWSTRRRVGLAS